MKRAAPGQLDLLADLPRRDAAMAAAADHADRESDGWSDEAYSALRSHAKHVERFMSQDVVAAAHAAGLPEPPDRRAWGAVTHRAVRAGIIKRDGFQLDRFASPKPVWRSLIYRPT